MEAVLDSKDYDRITAEVLKRITAKFDLVPKKEKKPIIGMEEFRKDYAYGKDSRWVKLYIFAAYPETSEWAVGVGQGKGHHIRINRAKAQAWMNKHESEIDWNKSLPRE